MKTFVTQIELEELIKNHQPMLVIDVRSASEFESGHIPFALNMQLDEIQKIKSPWRHTLSSLPYAAKVEVDRQRPHYGFENIIISSHFI
jgi:hypothetical protein